MIHNSSIKMDIEFENLCYSIKPPGFRTERKQILKSVTGTFCAGQLTAIMGPSGAGKSSLLNVLAGYDESGVTGAIRINGTPRNMKYFKKVSTYIMQDDLLQLRITVKEAMIYAAKLKLGTNLPKELIEDKVMDIINDLGLYSCKDTRTESLSGGQRKRLAVALELVNDPPFIFLDEPTSGLDTVAIKQCIELLNSLSTRGKTVICTIHQPPDSILKFFDKLYVMAEGHCIYNGTVNQVVPYLSSIGLQCPTTHNPTEYLIEVATKENLKLFKNNSMVANDNKIKQMYQMVPNGYYETNGKNTHNNNNSIKEGAEDFEFATGFWAQFYLLICRTFLQMARDKTFMWIQAFHHILSGGLMGGLFFGVGMDGSQAIANFKYCLCIMVFFAFTHTMTQVLLFPSEILLLKREYFNRWYSLKAYYAAMTITSLPLLVFAGLIFLIIAYLLAGQPLEFHRFFYFFLMSMLSAMASQALGLLVGSIFNIKLGSVVGPALSAPLLIFAVYGMGFGSSMNTYMLCLVKISYMRYAAGGLLHALFADRAPLACPPEEIYCHYADPSMLLRDMGMADVDYGMQAVGLIVIILLYRVLTYTVLRVRVGGSSGGNKWISVLDV